MLALLGRLLGRRLELAPGISSWLFAYYYLQKGFWPGIRGLLRGWMLGRVRQPLFLGARVRIRFPWLLRVGKSVSLGDNVHVNALSKGGVTLGDRVSIRENAVLQLSSHLDHLGDQIVIEDDVYIGPGAFIGAAATIRIGARTLIGPGLIIIAEGHDFAGTQPVFDQGVSRSGVTIGPECWLGARVTVLDGVQIGRGCVIGAGSVVTRSLPDYAVAMGVPARVTKIRQGGAHEATASR